MTTFHAFLAVSDDHYLLFVDIHLHQFNVKVGKILVDDIDIETYAIGVVNANSVEEAVNKIHMDQWEYTQKI